MNFSNKQECWNNKTDRSSTHTWCKTPTAVLEGLYLSWLTLLLQSHGKHIVPPPPSICRTREVRNHLVCGITTSTRADTNPTPASLPAVEQSIPSVPPPLPTLNEDLGGSWCVCLTLWLWFVWEEVILCHTDSFYGGWGLCWVSSLMMFLFKSFGSLWHSQLQLVCTHSLQLKCSLQPVHLRSALGQAKISLSKVWKYVAFAVLIEKDLKKKA